MQIAPAIVFVRDIMIVATVSQEEASVVSVNKSVVVNSEILITWEFPVIYKSVGNSRFFIKESTLEKRSSSHFFVDSFELC